MSKTTNYELEKYDDNMNCDFRFINGSLDKIDSELKKVSDKANEKKIIIKDIVLSKNSWGLLSSGIYFYNIVDKEIPSNSVVDINISLDNIINGQADDILSVTTSTAAGARVYARSTPLVDLNATMVIQKVVI